jgi:hypothetical protein
MRRFVIALSAALLGLTFATGALADGITPVGTPPPAPGSIVDVVRYTAAGGHIVRHDIMVDTSIVADPEFAADQVVGAAAQTSPTCASTPQPQGAVAEYCLNSWSWPAAAMPIRVKYNPVDPGGSDVVSIVAPLQAAIDAWSAVTPNFSYLFDGVTTARPTACEDESNADGINAVAWVDGIGGVNGILAQTCTVRTPDGALVEFDLEINAKMAWSVDTPTPPKTYDLYSNLLHELGHGAGLAHSQYPSAVMFQSLNAATEKRALTPDDIAGLEAKYNASGQGGAYHVIIPGLIRD